MTNRPAIGLPIKAFLAVILFVIMMFFVSLGTPTSVHADCWVNGYTKSNGTYVNGYYRTCADGNPYNNYSYPGNYNPHTGQTASGNPDTYLNNYYGTSGGSSSSFNSPSYPSTPSCPLMSSYDSLSSSCKCYSGYFAKNGSCVSGNSLCHSQIGIMSSYDSSTKTCTCDYGYYLDSSGQCSYKSTTSNYSSSKLTTSDYNSLLSSCPLNSHESPTDSTKCQCNAGYTVNTVLNGCIAAPVKSNDQLCTDANGLNSIWDGTKTSDGTRLNCTCKVGYSWNGTTKACVSTSASTTTPLTEETKQQLIAALQVQVQLLLAKIVELVAAKQQ